MCSIFWKDCFWKTEVAGQYRGRENAVLDTVVDCWLQEDQYEHLDAADVVKVEKSTGEAMEWMNQKLNLQNKQSLTTEPVVKAKEIEAKIKVLYVFKY